MSLRLATPTLRSASRILGCRSPMALVKIHSSAVANAATTQHPVDRLHGSYHWDLERVASVALVPMFAAEFALGSSPVLDTFFGVVLPVHIHLGLDALIVDYLNERKAPVAGKIAKAALYAATAGVMVGCYQFNTNDIGLTELVARVWTA